MLLFLSFGWSSEKLPLILVFALSIAALFIAQIHVSCSALAQRFPTIRMRIAANEQGFVQAGHC